MTRLILLGNRWTTSKRHNNYAPSNRGFLKGNTMNQFRAVTEQEFFAIIGKLDVTPYPRGSYPYRSEFTTRGGQVLGVIEREMKDPARHAETYLVRA